MNITVEQFLDRTQLVEALPGTPAFKRWQLWRNRKMEAFFATVTEAKRYCWRNGIKIDVIDHFNPDKRRAA